MLAKLVSFNTESQRSNLELIHFCRDYLASLGVESTLVPSEDGEKANLYATVGPKVDGGVVLSGHTDVVPVEGQDWTSDPWTLTERDGKLYGRGACDMKGFDAIALALVPEMLKAPLKRPVHIALSYDEEVGCVGVRHLIARLPELCPQPLGCIVGEPSGLHPVLRHKGKIAQRVTVDGKAGHSSRPDLGDNAIHYAAQLIAAVQDEALRHATAGPFAPAFAPPYSTIQVGTIQGGTGINIVPAQCVFEIEARSIAGQEPASLLAFLPGEAERIRAAAEQTGHRVAIGFETMSDYPPLDLDEADPLVALTEAASGMPRQQAVSFGTEAGLYQAAGIAAIVCGPGDVNRAHKPEEYITDGELAGAIAMIARVADTLAA
jgi:acetylornithine deacetylase